MASNVSTVLVPAIVCAVAAAACYGLAAAVQHVELSAPSGDDPGRTDWWDRTLGNGRWLGATLGDGGGLVLQVLALVLGPVVLVQPLLVLAVPFALLAGRRLARRRVSVRELALCGVVLAGLAVFGVVLGDPGRGTPAAPTTTVVAALIVAGTGLAAAAVSRRVGAGPRAALLGGVAGAWFGATGTLVDSLTLVGRQRGLPAVVAHAWPTSVAVVVLGVAATALLQVAYHAGPLAAAFTTCEVVGPVAAVVLGDVLLAQRIPFDGPSVVGYVIALGLVATATGALARAT